MIDRGKQYKIVATKDGYSQEEVLIDTRGYEKPGLITQEMLLDKFILQDLLPIALYFDNDLPDRKSKNITTNTVFGDLVNSYVKRKPEYIDRFTKPLKGEDKNSAMQSGVTDHLRHTDAQRCCTRVEALRLVGRNPEFQER